MANTEQFQSPAPFSTWVGVVLLFALFGVIALAVIGPTPRGDNYEQMRAEARAKKLKDARDEESKALTSYAWIDKNKGTVRLPINRAMELTVADLANKKPAAAYAIASPESSAAPGGAAGATPAPSPSPQSSGTPKTDFSRGSEFGSARTTRRRRESAGGAAFDPTRCIRFSCGFTEIIGRRTGRIAFSSSIRHAARQSIASSRRNSDSWSTTMTMSILPNE